MDIKALPLHDFISLSSGMSESSQKHSKYILTSIERVPGKGRSFFGLFTPLDSVGLPEFYLPCSQGIVVGTVVSNILPGE